MRCEVINAKRERAPCFGGRGLFSELGEALDKLPDRVIGDAFTQARDGLFIETHHRVAPRSSADCLCDAVNEISAWGVDLKFNQHRKIAHRIQGLFKGGNG